MKKIMILGGGENQVPLIVRAKKLNLFVVLCDVRDDIPGIALSDVHYRINYLNPEQLIEVGEKENPDGILTNSEPAFITMAEVAERLSLHCLNIESTNLFKNKYLMREFCHKHGIPSPQYRRCTNVEESIDFFNKVQKSA